MKNFSSQLAGQIGESLVVAELGRRGIVATAFAGNVPDVDLLAYRNGRTCALQVKALKRGEFGVNASNFIEIAQEGDRQSVVGRRPLDPELIFVFVRIGLSLGADRFFILTQRELQDVLVDHYTSNLERHGGVRPRNPKTSHSSVRTDELMRRGHEDRWDLIDERLPAHSP